jgi:hypothetical protein
MALFGSTKDLLLLLFVYLLNLICNPPPTFFTLLHLCFCEEQSENLVGTTKNPTPRLPHPTPTPQGKILGILDAILHWL